MKNNLLVVLLILVSSCTVTDRRNNGGGSSGTGVRAFTSIQQESSRIPLEVFQKGGRTPTDDTSGTSDAFRIPGILTLDNGHVVFAGDVRWASTSDSAHNIDSAIRISTDNGQTWGKMRYIQEFDDFASENVIGSDGNRSVVAMSASYIDPGIVQAANGDILVVTTVFPRGAGLFNNASTGETKINTLNPFVRYAGELYIILRPKAVTTGFTTDATYTMMAPVKGGAVVNRDGSAITGAFAGYSIDENWIVRKPDGTIFTSPQYLSGNSRANLVEVTPTKMINTHLFYYNSPFHPVGKSYIFMARSTDGGQTFSYPKDISHQFMDPATTSVLQDKWFYGVSPGVGYRLRESQKYPNRILIALQPVITACFATSLYSDDNGVTWKTGQPVTETLIDDVDGSSKTASRLSETQYVEGPEDQLFAFHRTGGLGRIAYSISIDGGVTWVAHRLSPLDSVTGGGVMIGATRLYNSELFGQKMLALSFPQSSSRTTGVVQIGFFRQSEQNFTGTQTRMYLPTFPGLVDNDANFWAYITPQDRNHNFGYSAITELPNGNLGVAYEYHNDPIPASGGERSLDFSEIQLIRQ